MMALQHQEQAGLPSIHFFSFPVLFQQLGSSNATRPEPRILHINPDAHISTCHVRILHKGSVTHAVRVEEISNVMCDDAQPCSLILAIKQQLHGGPQTRWLVDFNNDEDTTIFRLAFAAVSVRQYTPLLFANQVLMQGTVAKKGLSGFSTCYAVLVPSRIILLDSATSAFPRKVINLLCSNPSDIRWEPTQGVLHMATGMQPSLVTLKLGSRHPAWLAAIQQAIQISPTHDREAAALQQQGQHQPVMTRHTQLTTPAPATHHHDDTQPARRHHHHLPNSLVPADNQPATVDTACVQSSSTAGCTVWDGQCMQHAAASHQQSSLGHHHPDKGFADGMQADDAHPSVDELLLQAPAQSQRLSHIVAPMQGSWALPLVNQDEVQPQPIQQIYSRPTSASSTGTYHKRPTRLSVGHSHSLLSGSNHQPLQSEPTSLTHYLQSHDARHQLPQHHSHWQTLEQHAVVDTTELSTAQAVLDSVQSQIVRIQRTLTNQGMASPTTTCTRKPGTATIYCPDDDMCLQDTSATPTRARLPTGGCDRSSPIELGRQPSQQQQQQQQRGSMASTIAGESPRYYEQATGPHSHHDDSLRLGEQADVSQGSSRPSHLNTTTDRFGSATHRAPPARTTHTISSHCPFCSHSLPSEGEQCSSTVEHVSPDCQQAKTRQSTVQAVADYKYPVGDLRHTSLAHAPMAPTYVSTPTSSPPLQQAGELHPLPHDGWYDDGDSESLQEPSAYHTYEQPVYPRQSTRTTSAFSRQSQYNLTNKITSHLSLPETHADSLAMLDNSDAMYLQDPSALSSDEHTARGPGRVSTPNVRHTGTCLLNTECAAWQYHSNGSDRQSLAQPHRQPTSTCLHHLPCAHTHASRHSTWDHSTGPTVLKDMLEPHTYQISEQCAADDASTQQQWHCVESPVGRTSYATHSQAAQHHQPSWAVTRSRSSSSRSQAVDELVHQHSPVTRRPLPPACQPLAEELSFATHQYHDDVSVDQQLRLQSKRNTAVQLRDVIGTTGAHDMAYGTQQNPHILHPPPARCSNTAWPHTPTGITVKMHPAFSHVARKVSHTPTYAAVTRHPSGTVANQADDPELAAARRASAFIVPAAQQACDDVASAVSNMLSVFGYKSTGSVSCVQTPYQQLPSSYDNSHGAGRLQTVDRHHSLHPGKGSNFNSLASAVLQPWSNRHSQRPDSILAARHANSKTSKAMANTGSGAECAETLSAHQLDLREQLAAVFEYPVEQVQHTCQPSSQMLSTNQMLPTITTSNATVATSSRRSVSAPRSRQPTAVAHTAKSIHSLLKSLGSGALTPADVLNALH